MARFAKFVGCLIIARMCFTLSFAVSISQIVDKQKTLLSQSKPQEDLPAIPPAILHPNRNYVISRQLFYDEGQLETFLLKRSELFVNTEGLQLKRKKTAFHRRLQKRSSNKKDVQDKDQKVESLDGRKQRSIHGGNLGTNQKHVLFGNWDEYLQYQKSIINRTMEEHKSLEPEGPLVHSDDHFRFMDNLFKEKNDRVKTFHSLVLYMKKLGKEFKIPEKPDADK